MRRVDAEEGVPDDAGQSEVGPDPVHQVEDPAGNDAAADQAERADQAQILGPAARIGS